MSGSLHLADIVKGANT